MEVNPFQGKKIYYFIDIFAVRQGYNSPGMGIHNHHMLPDFQFPHAIRKAKVFATHWEPWFEPRVLLRSWCLNEMAYAQLYNKPVE
eukprot:16961-Pyramimonas_sp.AAC.1